MLNYKGVEVNDSQYAKIKDVQVKNGNSIQEHLVGSRKKLYSKNTLIATLSIDGSIFIGELKNQEFTSFLGRFNKQLYNQFLNNPALYDLKIVFNDTARGKNMDAWDKLSINEYFYNIDLKSAYWQIAFKLGYISKDMFNKYIKLDAFKQAKRLCISFLARPNNMYYMNIYGNYVIECNTLILRTVYDNIRNELYLSIKKSIEGIENWLDYNIDGVYVSKDDINLVRERLKDMNLQYKITECKKISETDFQYGHKLRKFKNK